MISTLFELKLLRRYERKNEEKKKKKYIYNYEKYTEGKGGRLKVRRAEMEKEARTGGLHTHARAG